MSRQQRRYTAEDVAMALATLESNGGNLSQTARDTGVPRKTLASWAESDGPTMPDGETRQEKRAELGEVWGDIAHRALGLTGDALKHLESLPDDERGKAALNHLPDLNRVAGTATDKHELLDGKPTERLAVSDDRIDAAVAADTIDFLEQVKRRKAGARKTG